MTVAELLAELKRRGVTVEAAGDRLRCWPRRAVTADLLERLALHKPALLAMLRGGRTEHENRNLLETRGKSSFGFGAEVEDRGITWDDCIEPDWSCGACGGIGWWEDIAGGRHCLACGRAGHERSQRLAERAARLRKVRPDARSRPEPPTPCKQSAPDPAKSGGRR